MTTRVDSKVFAVAARMKRSTSNTADVANKGGKRAREGSPVVEGRASTKSIAGDDVKASLRGHDKITEDMVVVRLRKIAAENEKLMLQESAMRYWSENILDGIVIEVRKKVFNGISRLYEISQYEKETGN